MLFRSFCFVSVVLTFHAYRFLGTRPVRLLRVMIQKNPAILALSSRPWLNYTYQNLMHFTPLIFENLDYAWSFSAELCPEGLIGISGSVLRRVFPVRCILIYFCHRRIAKTRMRDPEWPTYYGLVLKTS